MNRIKNISITGICDFECYHCKLQKNCMEHNKNNEPDLDQKEARKKFAGEYLLRVEIKK